MGIEAAIIMAAVSGAMQVTSTIMQGQQADDASKVQARNIRAEQRNKELEFAENSKRERIKAKRTISTIRAKLSQSGTDTNTGTPLAILGEAAGNIELSFQDAARQSAIESTSMAHAAASARFAGKQAKQASYLTAAGQGLQAAASAYTGYTGAVHSGSMPDTFHIYKPKPRNS